MRTVETAFTSFDRTRVISGRLARPEKARDVRSLLHSSDTPFIGRGSGLSYSPASMGSGVLSVDMRRFDRVLSFDPTSGAIEVEAGLTVGLLTDFIASRGFSLPVVPGYPEVTVGGCVAMDVHGKSQFHSGNFGSWVTHLNLNHPACGSVICSRESNRELFDLTIGGLGLTGLITRVGLRTAPLQGRSVELRSVPVGNLHHAAEVIRENAGKVDCIYSWHDFTATGANFGRGLIYLERFIPEPVSQKRPLRKMDIWTRFPISFWRQPAASLALTGYRLLSGRQPLRTLPLRAALFPIEGLEFYYAAFGHRGFREYQMIVPHGEWDVFVPSLQQLVETSKLPVTLASLKLFKGSPRLLSFAGEGICLAIDVPAAERSLAFFERLDFLAAKHHAPVNLSKDGRVPSALCQRVFEGYQGFKSGLLHFDPDRRCSSTLRGQIDA
jgi:decaprenylphospho-beta-D-ribofuranose 2-oxidase